jgi:hypothetical protein
VVLGQVPAEGVRAGVQPGLGQRLAQFQDELDGLIRGGRGAGARGPGARFERGLALGPPPGDELAHPSLGHPVGGSHLGLATALDDNGSDHELGFRHRRA